MTINYRRMGALSVGLLIGLAILMWSRGDDTVSTGDAMMAPIGAAVVQVDAPIDPLKRVELQAYLDAGLNPNDAERSTHEVPVYRSYMTVSARGLMCPAEGGVVPKQVEVALHVAEATGPFRHVELEPEWKERGVCRGFTWNAPASALWPDATEGVRRWAIVVGADAASPGPGSPSSWQAHGRRLRDGEVIFTGDSMPVLP